VNGKAAVEHGVATGHHRPPRATTGHHGAPGTEANPDEDRVKVDPENSDLAVSKASPCVDFSVSEPIKSHFQLSHVESDYVLSVERLLAHLIA